jgi:hypothetical protein
VVILSSRSATVAYGTNTCMSLVMRWKNGIHSFVALDFETAPLKLHEGCDNCPGCHCIHSVILLFLTHPCSSSSNPHTAVPRKLPSFEARDWNRKRCSIVVILGSRDVGFEVRPVFRDMAPCSSSKANRRFGGTCRLRLQGGRVSQGRNQHEADSKLS